MKVLDLFSGIGGFSLGLERAGMQTIAFCEIDKKCQLVLKKHWPNIPIYEDIKKLTWKKLKNDGIKKPDVICGGFPCQGFSVAGKQRGFEDERTALWFEYRRLISEIRPKYAVVENSRNMLSGKRGTWFSQFLASLAEIGYDAEWNIISAAGVGAPHLRERAWILAYPRMLRRWDDISGCVEQISVAGESEIRSSPTNEITRSSQRPETFPNSNGERCEKQRSSKPNEKEFTGIEYTCKTSTNSDKFNGINRRFRTSTPPLIKASDIQRSEFWSIESEVDRVVNGFPARVDQLKQLGNSVVPQIPELIGRVIINSKTNF
ncbi:DNA cytosine methyltransferase [Candidatus Pacearchaeota archaeon]|nr:DNA cytosine methyltransferase [Candidatus Pacearchaeota archaeon]